MVARRSLVEEVAVASAVTEIVTETAEAPAKGSIKLKNAVFHCEFVRQRRNHVGLFILTISHAVISSEPRHTRHLLGSASCQ